MSVSRKVVRLGTSGKTKFETPMKPSIRTMTDESPVHEFYRRVKPRSLDNCLNNQQYDSKYLQGIRSLRSEDSLNICHIEYDSKDSLPNEDQIRQMADLQYLSTDVIVIPSWFRLINKSANRLEEFFELSDKYYEYASFRNHKPVMASIPLCLSTSELPKVIKHFIDMDITSFVLDFNSRFMTKTTWVRSFMRELEEYNVQDESIVYSINAAYGTSHKTDKTCEAQDFLGFGAGIDLLGNKYSAKPSSDMYGESSMSEVKIFDPSHYTYHSRICTEDELWKYKVESAKKQITELGLIRDAIKHDENVMDIVKTKNLSDVTVRWLVEQNKTEPHRTVLDDFF